MAVRIGLIGCGRSAAQIHLPILVRLPGVELVALAELDPERRTAARRHCPRATTLADYHDLLWRDDVEAVVVCLPTALHAAAAVTAFARGKHVYLEKPLATSLDEGERVISAWERAGTVGMIGFNYRYNSLYVSARQHLQAGRLGPLVAARSVFAVPLREMPTWKKSRRAGGGVLLDFASHHVDLVRFLLGREILSAFAKLRSQRSEDDTLLLELEPEGGPPIQSFFSYAAIDEERFEIYGEGGKLTVERSRYQDVVLAGPTLRWARLRRLAHALRSTARAPYVLEKRLTPGHEPSHRAALTRFVDAVRRRGPATPDLRDGYACLEVLAAAERSAQIGRAVDLPRSRSRTASAVGELEGGVVALGGTAS